MERQDAEGAPGHLWLSQRVFAITTLSRRRRSARATWSTTCSRVSSAAVAAVAARSPRLGRRRRATRHRCTAQPPRPGRRRHGRRHPVQRPCPSRAIDNSTEEVTVGQSRGEEVNGQYQGRVILLDENLRQPGPGRDRHPGGSAARDAGAAAARARQRSAPALGQAANCATVLNMSSNSTATGSQNSFAVASDGHWPGPAATARSLSVQPRRRTSSGNITDDGTCQTATGSSNVADADLGLPVLPGDHGRRAPGHSSQSTACNNGTRAQPELHRCRTCRRGTPCPGRGLRERHPGHELRVLRAHSCADVCHADTLNAGQTSAPYGVREALTVFGLCWASRR